jgi:hypothetical protein
VNTPNDLRVIGSPVEASTRISANDARELAGISYRQLDHWARQGWVTPSVDAGIGRAGRRLYSIDDVVRLALLRHLAISRVNATVAGPAVSALATVDESEVVIWGPVPAGSSDEPSLAVVAASSALQVLEEGGAWVVFDPTPILQSARRKIDIGDVKETATRMRGAL